MATAVKSDVGIQQDVLNELSFDPEVDRTEIGVTVDDGVVTLTGTVTNYAEKWAAERAAFRVTGVRAVANEIVIKLPDTGTPDDTEIAKHIADVFAQNVSIPKNLHIRVAQGAVTLQGKVPWQYQRTTAESLAHGIRGVLSVANLITVEQPEIAPEAIGQEIKRALVRNAAVDADHVHVAVHGQEVVLTGTVRSWAERNEAEAAVWRTKGVIAVINTINVQQ